MIMHSNSNIIVTQAIMLYMAVTLISELVYCVTFENSLTFYSDAFLKVPNHNVLYKTYFTYRTYNTQ